MKMKSESEVAQSCPTLSDPVDCSLPGSSVHGIFQTRVLEYLEQATTCQGLSELYYVSQYFKEYQSQLIFILEYVIS